MAKPTIQQIADQARALLGDDQIPGGEIFSNNVLMPHIAQATRELFRVLRGAQDPFVLQDAYYTLPPFTSVLDPITAGLVGFAEPEFIASRQAGPKQHITDVVVGTGLDGEPNATLQVVAHGFSSGQTVITYGIVGFDDFNSPNGLWSITVANANAFSLNGCTAAGAYVSGGYVIGGGGRGEFTPMVPVSRIEAIADGAANSGSTQSVYAWEGNVLRFMATSDARELRITYRLSATTSTNPSSIIPIDDSQDFLATRAAGIAAATRGAPARANELNLEALGSGKIADGSGGILGELVRIDIRNLQRVVYRRPPFRARRNSRETLLF